MQISSYFQQASANFMNIIKTTSKGQKDLIKQHGQHHKQFIRKFKKG